MLRQSLSRPEVLGLLRSRSVLFWDFDGVIKDSVLVKADAFEGLFVPFGLDVAARVREHHERHGGVSRFEKLPLYLEWAGQPSTPEDIDRYCKLFSTAVLRAVIDAPWVPGAREYLQANHTTQSCAVVTATPQGEIEETLRALCATSWFHAVCGAPTTKADAIDSTLLRLASPREQALMIGDSESDLEAATKTGVGFLLRRTQLNHELQQTYRGPQCQDFLDG